jgi:hypothetical protein
MAGVHSMPSKNPLEKPIINAIIHYAYALREDEEAALLSAFLVISYHIHREAVESMLPDKNYEQFISARMLAMEASPAVLIQETSAVDAVAGQAYHESMITKHLQSFPHLFRRREILLQEEEEIALFRTIQGVADQVHREAIEREIRNGIGSTWRFGAAYGKAGEGPWGNIGVPVADVIAADESKNDDTKRPGYAMDTYIEFMDEELMITREIIDRNRALSQGYLNAKAM